ncbi:MAG: hypothetical protein AAF828_09050 [Bacteroidota bacterium]
MRVIGYLEHPSLKITVFTTDTRFPVQFERGGYVQIYRFRKSDRLNGLADIKQLVDTDFCNAVAAELLRMQQLEAKAWHRWEAKYGNDTEDLPTII